MAKVLIFGAGDFGGRYLSEIGKSGENGDITVLGFLDNNKEIQGRKIYGKYPCYPPEHVAEIECDKIIIANNTSDTIRSQIFKQLLTLGVSAEHIEYFPIEVFSEVCFDPRISFFHGFAGFAEEQNITGNIAECGVYKGETAKFMNKIFFNKKLYLFDTFEGFAQQDIEAEIELGDSGFISGPFNAVGGLRQTSIDLVMGKMTFPENVIIKKGWVPESFKGIEDTFCLVHLDMDLYQPMLAAMIFFWDKMSKGGVLLLHDYFHPELPGVKKAVDDFEAQIGRKVAKTPSCRNHCLTLIKD